MLTLFVDQLFPERLIKALCWTLVHSLWQGLALTIITGTLILLTRRSGARIRYGLFSAAFLLFLVAACGTFAWQWNKQGTGAGATNNAFVTLDATAPTNAERPILTESPVPAYQLMAEKLTDYFNEHASLIVTIWFIIFSARLVRILGGLGRMQRIRHYRTHVPSPYWTERMNALAARLHIKIPVALLESELIKAPMMAGIFKPVILLPFSLLSQLPVREVEAILLHELAHIRRKDYLINLLQSFAEILFFFNPGVWWISSLIREERENCCDDIAVGVAGNKKEFIHALVSFQEYGTAGDKYAISLRGAGNHLLQRVRRILYQDDKILDGREKFFLGCSLVIMLALALTLTSSPEARGAGRYLPPYGADAAFDGRIRIASDSDTVVALKRLPALRKSAAVRPGDTMESLYPIQSIDTLAREKAYRDEKLCRDEKAYRDENAKRADLSVDARIDAQVNAAFDETAAMARDTLAPSRGKDTLGPRKKFMRPIRPKIISDSPEVMEKMQRDQEIKQSEWKKKEEEFNLQAEEWKHAATGEARELSDKQRDELERQRKMLAEQQQLLAERERELFIAQQKLAEQERMLNKEAMEADGELKHREILDNKETLEKMEIMRKKETMSKPKIVSDEYERPERLEKVEMPERPERPERKELWERPESGANQKYISPIVRDLVAENLVIDPEEFSFELNGKELKVNGKRQPDDVYKRFAEKYIKDQKTELKYSRKKNGSESIHINVN